MIGRVMRLKEFYTRGRKHKKYMATAESNKLTEKKGRERGDGGGKKQRGEGKEQKKTIPK